MTPLYWVILCSVLAVIELATVNLVTVWFAVGALSAAVVSSAGGTFSVQMAVFLSASALCILFLRGVFRKKFNSRRVKTNVNALEGKLCRVVRRIDNAAGTGTVVTGGMEWTARSVCDGQVFPVGSEVKVVSVSGVKLIVMPVIKE